MLKFSVNQITSFCNSSEFFESLLLLHHAVAYFNVFRAREYLSIIMKLILLKKVIINFNVAMITHFYVKFLVEIH